MVLLTGFPPLIYCKSSQDKTFAKVQFVSKEYLHKLFVCLFFYKNTCLAINSYTSCFKILINFFMFMNAE